MADVEETDEDLTVEHTEALRRWRDVAAGMVHAGDAGIAPYFPPDANPLLATYVVVTVSRCAEHASLALYHWQDGTGSAELAIEELTLACRSVVDVADVVTRSPLAGFFRHGAACLTAVSADALVAVGYADPDQAEDPF
jgi:hypothetical protein